MSPDQLKAERAASEKRRLREPPKHRDERHLPLDACPDLAERMRLARVDYVEPEDLGAYGRRRWW